MEVKVVEVVVEDEERGWCSANAGPPFTRDGADIDCCLY
jgi:hypothetical protein